LTYNRQTSLCRQSIALVLTTTHTAIKKPKNTKRTNSGANKLALVKEKKHAKTQQNMQTHA